MALPAHKCLLFGFKKVPHVIVADDTFALKTYTMKPYPQKGLIEDKRIYNYCLSCAKKNCRVYIAKILKQCNPSLDVVLYRATPHTSKSVRPRQMMMLEREIRPSYLHWNPQTSTVQGFGATLCVYCGVQNDQHWTIWLCRRVHRRA